MSKAASAKRYAKALLEVAKAHQAVSEIKRQYGELVEVLEAHKEVSLLLRHPQIGIEDKKALLLKLLSYANPVFLNFLQLMVDKGREGILKETYGQFTHLVNQNEGIAEVKITSATSLDQEVVEGIAKSFSKQLNKKVITETVVDKSLIGGVTVRVGDRLYDGSIKGKLNRLSKKLSV